jgi:hypothetical protein
LISTLFTTALTTVTANQELLDAADNAVAQITANINGILPKSLPLLGLVIAITAAIGVFKRITRSAVSG